MSVVIPSFSAISAAEFRQLLDEYDALIESMSTAKPGKLELSVESYAQCEEKDKER